MTPQRARRAALDVLETLIVRRSKIERGLADKPTGPAADALRRKHKRVNAQIEKAVSDGKGRA